MKYALLAALGLLVAACTTESGDFDAMNVPNELDARGVSFGVGRVPGEKALTLQVHFKIAATGEDAPPVTDAAWMEAAQKAAPKGCTVKSLTPTPNGGRKAEYSC